jgi:hypothetical protein
LIGKSTMYKRGFRSELMDVIYKAVAPTEV